MLKTAHEAVFKFAFSKPAHAAGLFASLLPPTLTELLVFSTLRLCPGSFVDEALSERHSDLLFEVEVEGGGRRLLYLLF